MAGNLHIAVVEEDHERALMIVDGLRDAGDYEITVIGDVSTWRAGWPRWRRTLY